MEKKKFNRGTMTGGIVRIAIAVVAIIIAINVIASSIKADDSDDKFGTIFMCLIGGIMLIAAIGFIGNIPLANQTASTIRITNGMMFLGSEFMMFCLFLKISNLFFTYLIYKNKIAGIIVSIIAVTIHGEFGIIGDTQKYRFVINW